MKLCCKAVTLANPCRFSYVIALTSVFLFSLLNSKLKVNTRIPITCVIFTNMVIVVFILNKIIRAVAAAAVGVEEERRLFIF